MTLPSDSIKDMKKVAKGAGLSLAGSLFGKGLWLLCQVIIARHFGGTDFGIYVIGLIVLRVSDIFARLGLHAGSMRFVSIFRKENAGKVKGVIISSLTLSFLNGIVIGGVVYFSAGFISEVIFHKPNLSNIIKEFSFCLPFMSSMKVVAGATKGFHSAKYNIYIKDIIQPIINILMVLFAVYFNLEIISIIDAYTISHVIALIVGVYFIILQFSKIKDGKSRSIFEPTVLLSYSVPLMFSGFLIFFLSWTDVIMLGIMKNELDVGIYRAASQLPIIFAIILSSFNSIYAPMVADMFHKKQKHRLETIFKTNSYWVFLLSIPTGLIYFSSADDLMLIFGVDFISQGVPVLIAITTGQLINCFTGTVGITLNMTGKQKVEMINSIVLVILNIILNIILIPLYGSLGAAIATGISIGSINILRLFEVYFFYTIHPYSPKYIHGVIYGFIAIGLLYYLSPQFSGNSPITRFSSHVTLISFIFMIYLSLFGIKSDDKVLLNSIKQKIFR